MRLLTAGSNEYGQLGRPTQLNRSCDFVAIDARVDIAVVSSGSWHTAAVTSTGELLLWGRNNYGQCGIPCASFPVVMTPTQLPLAHQICGVACGHQHTVLLTTAGAVLTFGNNNYGQLGIGSFTSCSKPSEARCPEDIQAVFSGPHTSYAVGSSGSVYAWGETSFLLLSDIQSTGRSSLVPLPTALALGPFERHIEKVVAGSHFALFVSTSGEVLGCGNNDHGQLGVVDARPHRLHLLAKGRTVRDIDVGFSHTALLAPDGRVSLCGSLKTSNEKVVGHRVPCELQRLDHIDGIGCGPSCVFGWNVSGCWALGFNHDGMLGTGSFHHAADIPALVPLPWTARVLQSSCGVSHTVLLISAEPRHRVEPPCLLNREQDEKFPLLNGEVMFSLSFSKNPSNMVSLDPFRNAKRIVLIVGVAIVHILVRRYRSAINQLSV